MRRRWRMVAATARSGLAGKSDRTGRPGVISCASSNGPGGRLRFCCRAGRSTQFRADRQSADTGRDGLIPRRRFPPTPGDCGNRELPAIRDGHKPSKSRSSVVGIAVKCGRNLQITLSAWRWSAPSNKVNLPSAIFSKCSLPCSSAWLTRSSGTPPRRAP